MIFSTVRFRRKSKVASRVSGIGSLVTRYGLVLVLSWIGAMKFTTYEVENIRPVVEGSPLCAGCIRRRIREHLPPDWEWSSLAPQV